MAECQSNNTKGAQNIKRYTNLYQRQELIFSRHEKMNAYNIQPLDSTGNHVCVVDLAKPCVVASCPLALVARILA